MFKRLKNLVSGRDGQQDDASPQGENAAPETLDLSLTLPNPFGGEPLCRAWVKFSSRDRGLGESWRLQAHLQSCWLPAEGLGRDRQLPPPAGLRGILSRGQSVASQMAERGAGLLPASLRPLLQQHMQTWVDLRGSNQPLVDGAQALVPEPLRQMQAQMPARVPGQPRVLNWRGPLGGGRRGVAQFSTLQIDQDDFPAGSFAGQPFSLSASVATVIEHGAAADPKKADEDH